MLALNTLDVEQSLLKYVAGTYSMNPSCLVIHHIHTIIIKS